MPIASASGLLEGQRGNAVLADKAYDGNDLPSQIAAMHAEAVISSKRSRKVAIPHDASIYILTNSDNGWRVILPILARTGSDRTLIAFLRGQIN